MSKESALQKYGEARHLLRSTNTPSLIVRPYTFGHGNSRSALRESEFPLRLLHGEDDAFFMAYNALAQPEQMVLEQLLGIFVDTIGKGCEGEITFTPTQVKNLNKVGSSGYEVSFQDNVDGNSVLLCPKLDDVILRTKLYDRNLYSQGTGRDVADIAQDQHGTATVHEGFQSQNPEGETKTTAMTRVCSLKKTVERVPLSWAQPNHVVYLMDGFDSGELNIGLYDPPLFVQDKGLLTVRVSAQGATLDEVFGTFCSFLKDAMFKMSHESDQPRFVLDHLSPIIYSIEKLLRQGHNFYRAKVHDQRIRKSRSYRGPEMQTVPPEVVQGIVDEFYASIQPREDTTKEDISPGNQTDIVGKSY